MSLTLCPAGIQAIIAYEVFVLGRDVLGKLIVAQEVASGVKREYFY